MRLGRLTAVAICGALVAAAPAAAQPNQAGAKSQRCKKAKQHKRFTCERPREAAVTTTCPDGSTAVWFTSFPDADLNANHVVCFADGVGAVDDTPADGAL